MDNPAPVSSVLPMVTVIEYLILLMIATNPAHGYGIMQQITVHTNNEIRLRPGTLYGALKKLLEEKHWIEASEPMPVSELDSERRRYYQLTKAGREVLIQEIRRMDFLRDMGRAKLGIEVACAEGKETEGVGMLSN